MLNRKEISADFCVVGGGMAGICAAIAAAREGISVVLMHERPVLGGNASSEIRMWVCGAQGEEQTFTAAMKISGIWSLAVTATRLTIRRR